MESNVVNIRTKATEYDGYSLFEDIEDADLRARNRGVVMANMLEHQIANNRVPAKALLDLSNYLRMLPEEERRAAYDALDKSLVERGLRGEH